MEHEERVADDSTRRDELQRKTWVAPQIRDLPKLTDLTLLTGSPIEGGGSTGGGGGGVF